MLIAVTRGRGKTRVAGINSGINNTNHHTGAAIATLPRRCRPKRLSANKRWAGIGLQGAGEFDFDAFDAGLTGQGCGGFRRKR